MIFKGKKTSCISFPLGGIGSGSIGITGNGGLRDWEISNRPNKGSYNGLTHFAVRAEEDGRVTDFRVLQGDFPPHYMGDYSATQAHTGYGFGPCEGTLAHLPHFRKHTFEGTYPVCTLDFGGEKFPGKCSMTAWSVLIPGESLPSSLPAAFFEIDLENPGTKAITYTAICVLSNPWSSNPGGYNNYADDTLTCFDGSGAGDISVSVDAAGSVISHQTNLYRGYWRDPMEIYFRDVMTSGDFTERCYGPAAVPGLDSGLLAARFTLAPGERKSTRFIITWSVPERDMSEMKGRRERAEKQNVKWTWKNFYATCWENSRESAKYALDNYDDLRRKTFCFRDTLFNSTIPAEIVDGIASNLSVLKSPTCMRLEDGTFYSWEGVTTKFGSCEGSCTHVLNYAQALAFLFPDLERSMRESHLKYSVDELGGSHFRLMLPLGIHADTEDFHPCADGQFGDVMKIYRDWKIGGDDEYIRRHWPTIKKTIEYAWHPQNPHRWDPQECGVLTGRQHHTLDQELFGPNSWLTGHYLGALDAAAQLADFMGDKAFAAKCRRIRRKGAAWVNRQLFNGEFFHQSIDLTDKGILDSFLGASKDSYDLAEVYWSPERGEIKYQIGEGCGIDAVLAQNYADLYGLNRIFEIRKYRKTLNSIYKYNFKKSMRDFTNLWRIFSLNDEGGTVICTWPNDRKPAIPIPYNTETMTGFEWAFATALAHEGQISRAYTVSRAIRQRFDGEKRNPYNEFECGSNYARSLASYGLLVALSGFQYDRNAGMLGFCPKYSGTSFQSFWALGDVWGSFRQEKEEAVITVMHGTFTLKELRLNRAYAPITLPVALKTGDSLTVKFNPVAQC